MTNSQQGARTEDVRAVRLQEQNRCTNCCGQGYFGQGTDCRTCAGTGKVPACKTVTNHRQCLLKDGHATDHYFGAPS